ncbi:sulfite exporter TauE/SafE family protein [Cryptosporangium phraense]|uniref:Probable membrane transporter protein n=1 Tax=Cryptosporangium phraense TaxID=2593070 RepID=A0A545AN32_9ACTN|nr:sulfite exporter TauE/SafE family protein [Cryptosporangium phraense]TQS42155.1 sulfite exporter TauE/SafE family protein [Cryptosporangium phraense]
MEGWAGAAAGFAAGLLIAIVTTPVGVSGAVFLLPVQLSVLQVPSPAVTPTNLLFNVVAGPGALLRYARAGQLNGPLTRRLLAGTVPGVAVGATVRVFLLPGATVFKLVAAGVLVPLGVWLCLRTVRPSPPTDAPVRRVALLAFVVGVVGGIYGIGGGSIMGPILVGRGQPVSLVAPAALASTFAASLSGALVYAGLALTTSVSAAPHWTLGLLAGLGGLVGGYVGALVQPRLPENGLRLLLGVTATAVGVLYAAESWPRPT